MKCLVLAAGMSTRIAALTGGAPKPLTPVAGIPVLHRNLTWLARHGIREMYINLHYQAAEIRASVGDGAALGVKIAWSEEDPILGTAGAAKKLERELTAGGGPFLLVYGDNVFSFDLARMIADHMSRRGLTPVCGSMQTGCLSPPSPLLGTIAVFDTAKNLHTGIAGGRVAADAGGRITGFVEGQPEAPGNVNAACYVLENAVLQYIPPPPQATDWARQTFPQMLAAGLHLRSYLIEGYCLGIDTPESYARAQEYFRSGRLR
ncbi:MAG: NDP-sugar synthase [Planctomycetota bacterium]|nr:NDP-sugar synthase [Planctomycetota bacterium]